MYYICKHTIKLTKENLLKIRDHPEILYNNQNILNSAKGIDLIQALSLDSSDSGNLDNRIRCWILPIIRRLVAYWTKANWVRNSTLLCYLLS